jgi:hypothetical protein
VIPDRTKTSTSEDGGIVWTGVPAGTYRVQTSSPTTRFASFLATCAPGRIVNANPPWGAYELSPGEKPLAAGTVAASVVGASVERPAKGRAAVVLTVRAGEQVGVGAVVRSHGKRIGHRTTGIGRARERVIRVPLKPLRDARRVRVTMQFVDAVKERARPSFALKVPPKG